MKAYSQGITKEEFVKELKDHQKADQFIKGVYWENGKGCAVGCSIDSISRIKNKQLEYTQHSIYEEHLGIPEWLAKLEDTIFEGISDERSKKWPVEFGEAINPGADLQETRVPIIVMILEHTLVSMDKCLFDREASPDVARCLEGSKRAVLQMIEAQRSGDENKIALAEYAAESAAGSAVWSAKYAESAEYAAESAKYAEYAAESAKYAAESAKYAEYAAESAEYAAGSAAYEYYADRILEILKETK